MPSPEKNIPVIVILGATGVGKTAVALELANTLSGEIISADSRLFYRGMDIGTAKPTVKEREQVPHHLIDIADPDDNWSLARFQQAAIETIREIHEKGKPVLLVGGTGQYLKAVLEGWQIPEIPPNESLREALTDWAGEIGAVGLYERLASIDPAAVKTMTPQNLRRTVRALEIIFTLGKKFSEVRTKKPTPYRVLQIGLRRPKEILIERIDQRVDQMIAAGFMDEVRDLLDQGFSSDLPSMSAIGYRQLAAHLTGEITLEEAVREIKRITKKFVRRQNTWFKPDDPEIVWFDIQNKGVMEITNLTEDFLDQ